MWNEWKREGYFEQGKRKGTCETDGTEEGYFEQGERQGTCGTKETEGTCGTDETNGDTMNNIV